MAEPIVSLPPGSYPGAQTVTVTFPPGVRKAIVTHEDRAPVLSEILAYDEGPMVAGGPNVPRPFIAVTQDGRGNVVYDGGFPKFYNTMMTSGGVWPRPRPNTWEQIPPSYKYLVNAIKFCANPTKVAQGNKKILCIGSAKLGENYNVRSSFYEPLTGQGAAGSSFGDAFLTIAEVAGFAADFYDSTISGTVPTSIPYETLDQYAVVLYLASVFTPTSPNVRIDLEFAKTLAYYREQGNGLIIITDHTDNTYTSINDALARPNGFVREANIISQYFGAYFTGNFNRSSVKVGEIRRQIGLPGPPGDHPLLANLADTDSIFAGSSESIIVPELYPNEVVDPTVPFVYDMLTPGTYRVNVLMQMEDGSIVTKPLQYVIGDTSAIVMANTLGAELGAEYPTVKRAFDFKLRHRTVPNTAMSGEIVRNGILQGYFTHTNDVTMYQMFSGAAASMPMIGNDVVGFNLKVPFEYNVSTKIVEESYGDLRLASGNYPQFLKALLSKTEYRGYSVDRVIRDATYFGDNRFANFPDRGNILMSQVWRTMGKARLPYNQQRLCDAVMWVALDPADWVANKPANPVRGTAIVIASTNEVYYWETITRTWIKHPQAVDLLIGYPRFIANTRVANERWSIGRNSTIKV